MRTLNKIALGAAVVVLLAAAVQPSQAACTDPRLLDTAGDYLVSNPNWGGAGAVPGSPTGGSCGAYGCYQADSAGPISASIAGFFWAAGAAGSAGDPTTGAGIDNGDWAVGNWTKSRSDVFTNGVYYYPAWLSLDTVGEPNYVSGNPANWSFAGDGCITDVDGPAIDPTECTCFMLTDQWDGQGYFAIMSANTDAIGNFAFGTAQGVIRLAAIPAPQIASSVRETDPITGDPTGPVTFSVLLPQLPAAGDYRQGCDCGVGFKVAHQIVGRGGGAPVDRSQGWTVSATTSAPGATATAVVNCDPALQQDVYLALAVAADGVGAAPDFVGANVSGNSFRVECGANIAQPERPQPGRSSDAPRGRDNNRGRKDR